ncbi:hypothetical protein BDDG_04855 [Blastomyces dermatitidis ATCC 18188]|uniref:Uncharacterized protein n=1 Tax=Ajellomyces dermatitidis (strain ATCC 18188 / CBS 674.68) TaxID=653446 RepID=F2TF99_AJEDA|nr:hypothetical protein BDDG_04855 [Blastomyces dermatitidis ATCC 18188]
MEPTYRRKPVGLGVRSRIINGPPRRFWRELPRIIIYRTGYEAKHGHPRLMLRSQTPEQAIASGIPRRIIILKLPNGFSALIIMVNGQVRVEQADLGHK